MRKAAESIEGHAAVIVALLTVAAAALGVLSASLKIKADTAVECRDRVQSKATGLQSDKTSLQTQIAALQEENSNLRAKLGNRPAATGDYRMLTRDFKVPISEMIAVRSTSPRQGGVGDRCCQGNFIYDRQEATGQPQLRAGSDVTYSIDIASIGVGQQQCSDAVNQRPAAAPVRNLHVGTLICAKSDGGMSLLRVVGAPGQDGRLGLEVRFGPVAPVPRPISRRAEGAV